MRDNKKNYLKRGEREREIRRIRNNIKYVRDNKKLFLKKKYHLATAWLQNIVVAWLQNF